MKSGLTIASPTWSASSEIRTWLAFIFLGGSLLFFSRSFTNYFVCYDYEFLGRMDLSTARQYLTHTWGYGNEYRPLLAYSYTLDGAVSGYNPIGYHLTNTVLHTANALLVGLLAEVCGVPAAAALFVSLILLLNPVAHESVLWIAGRPVVLSAFFVLLSAYSFLKAARPGHGSFKWWVAMYMSFVAGLLAYEGAAVLPLLVVLLLVFLPGSHPRWCFVHVAILFLVLAAYMLAWNWFFGFRITRFPVESSILGALGSLGNAITQSLHGSLRLIIAPVYVVIIAAVLRQQEGRKSALLSLGWFVIGYLPFFIVRGYADRFAYLSSVGTAFLLASGLLALYQSKFKTLGLAMAAGLLAFYAIGMQNRITLWKEAGAIAFQIPREIKALVPHLQPGITLVVLNVPDMHTHAYVYLTGLERAIALQYPGATFQIRRQLDQQAPVGPVFDYSTGHIREISRENQR